MANFCKQCGAPLDPAMRFCPECGTLMEENVTPAPKGSGDAKKWILVALTVILVGGGGWYLGRSGKTDAPAQSAVPIVPASPKTSAGNSAPVAAPIEDPRSNFEKAAEELAKYGLRYNVDATSYGHSPDGFMVLDMEGALVIVDRVNQQVASIKMGKSMGPKGVNGILDIPKQRYKPGSHVLIPQFRIYDAVRDNDAEYGTWEGTTHKFPIYCLYEFDEAGNIVPGMLTSGKGANPSHYQGVLKEQRSVDLANLFLTEIIPLCDSCNRR